MQWGKWIDAIEDLKRWQETTLEPDINLVHWQSLAVSERFYVPWAMNLLDGKIIDQDIKRVMRLPYSCVSILSECDLEGGRTWKFSIAFDLDGEANKRYRWIPPDGHDFEGRAGYALLSLVLSPKNSRPDRHPGKWLPVPPGVIFCEYPPEHDGYKLSWMTAIKPILDMPEADRGALREEYICDAAAVQNLCMMLSLHNVRTERVDAPSKLNKKREARGSEPLMKYHVLRVNGELWDGPPRSSRDSDGCRSHMRRGHIRRLDEHRRVWVSSCFVRGRKDGFVDKEYFVQHQ